MAAWYRRATDGGIIIRFDYDERFIALLKMRIPSSHRRWIPEDRRWWIHQFFVDDALRMLRAKYGTIYDEDSWKQKTESKPNAPKTDGLFSVLHLLPSAPLFVVEAAYRAMAKNCHPDVRPEDRENATRKMAEINSLIDDIRERAKSNRP